LFEQPRRERSRVLLVTRFSGGPTPPTFLTLRRKTLPAPWQKRRNPGATDAVRDDRFVIGFLKTLALGWDDAMEVNQERSGRSIRQDETAVLVERTHDVAHAP